MAMHWIDDEDYEMANESIGDAVTLCLEPEKEQEQDDAAVISKKAQPCGKDDESTSSDNSLKANDDDCDENIPTDTPTNKPSRLLYKISDYNEECLY